MHPGVHGTFARQEGLITHGQALDLGVTSSVIAALVRAEDWVRMRKGVYADGEVWRSLDPWHGQPLLRAKAAVLRMRRGWVLSHDSAAHALELDVLVVRRPLVHVTRPGVTNAWTKAGVKHHLAPFEADQRVMVGGQPVLDAARTVADITREHGVRHGLVVADAALRSGVPRRDLWRAVDAMAYWRHVTRCRTVVELADGGAQNAAETLGRELVLELGIGVPDTQWPLQLSTGGIAWCDIRVGRHIFEVHGLVKYLPVDEGGVASQPAARVVWKERRRERLVREEGLGVTNLYWEDYWGSARDSAKARALADWHETVARFGTELPERLARNAREIRARDRRPGAS